MITLKQAQKIASQIPGMSKAARQAREARLYHQEQDAELERELARQAEANAPAPEFAVGQTVQVDFVDVNAFNGRDKHPLKTDLGFKGVIVAILSHDTYDDCSPCTCYRVCNVDGKALDLMNHEIQAAPVNNGGKPLESEHHQIGGF